MISIASYRWMIKLYENAANGDVGVSNHENVQKRQGNSGKFSELQHTNLEYIALEEIFHC